jgi:hypothetical protein
MAIPNNAVLQDDQLSRIELKLYRSAKYPATWLAFSQETGWLMFPTEVGGGKSDESPVVSIPTPSRRFRLAVGPTQQLRRVWHEANSRSDGSDASGNA